MAYIKRAGNPASFNLQLPCQILKIRGEPVHVRCNTVSISGREVVLSNISFTASPSDPIEFEIEMPMPQNEPQVRLRCVGRISHCAPLGTTLTIERYVFRRGVPESG